MSKVVKIYEYETLLPLVDFPITTVVVLFDNQRILDNREQMKRAFAHFENVKFKTKLKKGVARISHDGITKDIAGALYWYGLKSTQEEDIIVVDLNQERW